MVVFRQLKWWFTAEFTNKKGGEKLGEVAIEPIFRAAIHIDEWIGDLMVAFWWFGDLMGTKKSYWRLIPMMNSIKQ